MQRGWQCLMRAYDYYCYTYGAVLNLTVPPHTHLHIDKNIIAPSPETDCLLAFLHEKYCAACQGLGEQKLEGL